MMRYPRYLSPGMEPYDPLEITKLTEQIVCKGDSRKYTEFYCVGVYGGISTGYAVGCNLRCAFCWISWSRDFPESFGEFYSPEEVFRNLNRAAIKSGISKLRISGAEPTLGKNHLLPLLGLVEHSELKRFILETNGILFGADKDYAIQASGYKKIHIRVSLKAGTPEDFQRKTGARKEAFELPFKAIENLLDCGASFHVAAMSGDPRIMGEEERLSLIKRLWEIDKRLVFNLEEEIIDPYDTTLRRLQHAGMDIPFPLTKRYVPIQSLFK